MPLKNNRKNSTAVELRQEAGYLQLPVQEELRMDCRERPPPLTDCTRAVRLGTRDDVPTAHHQQKIYAFPGQLSSSLHTHDETTGRCNLHTLCSGTYIHGKGNRGWYCVTAPHVTSRQLPRGCEGPGIVYALPGCVEVGHVAVKHDSLDKWFVVIKVCGSFQMNQLQKMNVGSDGGSQAGFLRGDGKSILAVPMAALEDDSASKAGSPGEELRMWVQPDEHLPLGTPRMPCMKTGHLRAKETPVHDVREQHIPSDMQHRLAHNHEGSLVSLRGKNGVLERHVGIVMCFQYDGGKVKKALVMPFRPIWKAIETLETT